jgi:hypothetical protein
MCPSGVAFIYNANTKLITIVSSSYEQIVSTENILVADNFSSIWSKETMDRCEAAW